MSLFLSFLLILTGNFLRPLTSSFNPCSYLNFSEKWQTYFSSTLEQMVRVKDSDNRASIEFGIGESFRNMDEMFETIEIGDQERDLRINPYSVT